MEWYYGSCKEKNLQKGKSEKYRFQASLKKDGAETVNSAASAAYLNK